MKTIQETFDLLQTNKSNLSKLQKDRKDSIILESSEYESLTKEIEEKSEYRKKIELDFDEAHPTMRAKLDNAAERVAELSDSLTMLIVSALSRGETVEVIHTRNGKKKKLRPKFKIGFERQQRIFG